jgi:hypothetical protein
MKDEVARNLRVVNLLETREATDLNLLNGGLDPKTSAMTVKV